MCTNTSALRRPALRAKARIVEAFNGAAESRALPENIVAGSQNHTVSIQENCRALPKNIREMSCSEDARNFHLPDGTTLVTMTHLFFGF
jgi:hypothetical protein